eukprot:3551430-Prorocentrum_lima.AAC.1
MLPQHREGILTGLGLPLAEARRFVMSVDSSEWGIYPRRRLLFSTLPNPSVAWQPRQRPSPFDQGWVPHSQGRIAAMLRQRG